MATKKTFLNPGLETNQLAEEIDLSPRILSQIINEYFNQSFYDYINKLRIEEAIKLLDDLVNKMNILEIFYSVGFNSKPSFNTAFKKVTGLIPTEFKKKRSPERKLQLLLPEITLILNKFS
jgi:YesN/AraC family two-component response regulator